MRWSEGGESLYKESELNAAITKAVGRARLVWIGVGFAVAWASMVAGALVTVWFR